MLKGLAIVEKNLSKISDNKDFRLDSSFYTDEPFYNPNLIYEKIGECLEVSQYGISISMNEDGIGYPIYRMNEIHNMLCDFNVSKHADINNKEAKLFILNDKDVLFNRTNSFEWVGRTGIYRKESEEDFIFASYLVRFVPNEKITPEYLTAFLSCKYGVQEIRRRARQSINQTNVNPEEVKQIDIPIFGLILQNIITQNFDTSYDLLRLSEEMCHQAENLLLAELNLVDFQPNEQGINVKSLKDSFVLAFKKAVFFKIIYNWFYFGEINYERKKTAKTFYC